ncbi:Acyl-CoA synthetase (AMP-forming)/AMP-acid ligase II [Thermomonospora echinospora]|uniref:Acyl-CoA synthetase (AMP-forming)/AMP-acid ligase II n=1 Tax=Thermomonospora echinospora TaxID=1992 RepID=A0A1H6DTD2_9ACTN|nr:AMP-binding protein [Thermomonospora echinospora]SEG88642.1 Acyl-CoA synthetase (AMP-forming)/AMP-acid ligase II [Thermomonospora echinospora]
MHLSRLAQAHPDKPAVVVAATGESVTYRELDAASIRLARLLADRGLMFGDHVALLIDNTPAYFAAAWACQRSGLYWTPVNHHLTVDEAAYIVRDCGARALIAARTLDRPAWEIANAAPDVEVRLICGGGETPDGFEDLDEAIAAYPAEERQGEREGYYMFYSSGTTGRPKGILPALTGDPFGTGLAIDHTLGGMFGFGDDTVYLCPAPLYHAAPTGWTLGTMRNGGTVVLMDRFDAGQALEYIERYRVTHVQFVPTMLIRMLKLPEDIRTRHDLSSLRTVVHAAAPCPVEVKHRIIEWLGPIVWEYYSGSEGNCFFLIDSADWLAHPGSVGRPAFGKVHILDDEGRELPAGEVGTVWFEETPDFKYHNDPDKTAGAHNERGWSTLGDVGRLDADGYLYLVDRRTDLILSGGVNIYPQEIENVLVVHPAVADVAVIGIPDPEMGRRVHAVVQPADPSVAGPELADELVAHCRRSLAGYKCPGTIEFAGELPRTPTGKLLRRLLTDRTVEETAS